VLPSTAPVTAQNHDSRAPATEARVACGCRLEEVPQPDGLVDYVMIPLAEAEFLHSQKGYRLPNSACHGTIAGDLKDMLNRRYAHRPDVGIFQDPIIK
jgi:hypothetical protein